MNTLDNCCIFCKQHLTKFENDHSSVLCGSCDRANDFDVQDNYPPKSDIFTSR